MKRLKRFWPVSLMISLLLFLLLIPITPAAAQAATRHLDTSSSEILHPQTYRMIENGSCQLADIGDGTINVSGSTSTYSSVAQVGLTLYLQYLSKGSWYTIETYSYSGYDTSYLSGGQHLAVSHGYSYRVFAEHTAYNGTTYETGYSYTEAVYIS
ncbi:hypothetical protein CEB3_c28620 [Peptococcaceae bacterium CEB3]|nr:hypothetical protein CEB3_c28620 [Peptococcaceae bacterium CEB3]